MSNTLERISDHPVWNYCFNLLLDDSISEVEANGRESFFVKKNGKRIKLGQVHMASDDEYMKSIEVGLIPHVTSHVPFDPNGYIFEGPLRFSAEVNGVTKNIRGRCHIILAPAADSPQITIAKKSTSLASLDDIASRGSMPSEVLKFVKASIAADLTTTISGGTGAGKALHKDTLIPTVNGMVPMGDIKVGDVLFDETGARTTVERKYCPMDPKSYELTFSNGEKMRASAGHLWAVTELTRKGKGKPPLAPLLSAQDVEKVKKLSGDDYITLRELFEETQIPQKTVLVNIFRNMAYPRPMMIEVKKLHESLAFKASRSNGHKARQLSEELLALSDKTIDIQDLKKQVPTTLRSGLLGFEMPSIDHVLTRDEAREVILAEHERRIVVKKENPSREKQVWVESVLTTSELAARGAVNNRGRKNFGIKRLSGAVDYPEATLSIDPYTLGAWLGDGISDRQSLCGVDFEIRDRIASIYELSRERSEQRPNQKQPVYEWKFDELRKLLKEEGLLQNKHIPSKYMKGSKAQRMELIAGLVDTDGYVDKKGTVSYSGTRLQIVEAARNIVLSLGWKASTITSKVPYAVLPGGERRAGKRAYSFSFWTTELPLQVERKAARLQERKAREETLSQQVRHERIYIESIVEVVDNPEDYFCIQVDSPSHLFLAGETFVPTHNTTFLEAMCKLIPLETRIGVAEDTPELELPHENTSYYHSVPARPGMDEKDVASLSWCVAQFNRARTDKLIIGETRGKEFADFLVAANSGMEGSLTTIHANDPVRALDKMTNFALKGSPGTPIRSINTDIGSSVDLIIQLAYFKADGRYRLTALQEITSTVSIDERASLTTNRLYTYDPNSDTWMKEANPTDALRERFRSHGVDISEILGTQPGTRLLPMGSVASEGNRAPQASGLPVRRI